MNKTPEVKKYYQEWWDNVLLSEEWRAHYHQTVVDYLEAEEKEPEDL